MAIEQFQRIKDSGGILRQDELGGSGSGRSVTSRNLLTFYLLVAPHRSAWGCELSQEKAPS
ncbi:hypothetical protein RGCCGE502_34456 (plasmid) [Rhizobium grahamii CCGE 502]|uniref:Uncharacterized protein n=1 Tax=Rhizobium grahamii CCGE 502 TaxID=990285 RepID=S3I2J2_9HYPH|nr:hypothetical protein RGCCGE502_34456 [Rhizobium grahamii CCGE 502]